MTKEPTAPREVPQHIAAVESAFTQKKSLLTNNLTGIGDEAGKM